MPNIDIIVQSNPIVIEIVPAVKPTIDIKFGQVDSVNGQTGAVILPRVTTIATATTATLDLTTTDELEITALASDVTFAVTGTPRKGQKIIGHYKDNGTQRNLNFSADFVALVTIPTNTTVGKVGVWGARWNDARGKWEIIAAVTEP